jgi:hypothetical protein
VYGILKQENIMKKIIRIIASWFFKNNKTKEVKPERTVFLFLDDIRMPVDAFSYTNKKMFIQEDWVIVRDYNQFVQHIELNGLPKMIAFDHDLADSHYTPEELWTDYEKSKAWQEQQVHKEKTGLECAKWLVEYCIDNDEELPDFFCHSQNPVGKDNIYWLLNNFKGHQKK